MTNFGFILNKIDCNSEDFFALNFQWHNWVQTFSHTLHFLQCLRNLDRTLVRIGRFLFSSHFLKWIIFETAGVKAKIDLILKPSHIYQVQFVQMPEGQFKVFSANQRCFYEWNFHSAYQLHFSVYLAKLKYQNHR